MILNRNASWNVGYYATWPVTLVVDGHGQARFAIALGRDRFQRVFYFTMRNRSPLPPQLFKLLARHGYRERERYASNIRTVLVLFERWP